MNKYIDIDSIEKELKKRLNFPYVWGRKQNNNFDELTSFIYRTKHFEELLDKIDKFFKKWNSYEDIKNYTMNRWFNFWSARCVEYIFCKCEGVKPELDNTNRLIDFYIRGINFDHKTSVFPEGYNSSIEEAIKNPFNLIKWLYENQSKQQRYHLKNRLFIILYDSVNKEHWKLKAEITSLKEGIFSYVSNFNAAKLLRFKFTPHSITLSDIIWVMK